MLSLSLRLKMRPLVAADFHGLAKDDAEGLLEGQGLQEEGPLSSQVGPAPRKPELGPQLSST